MSALTDRLAALPLEHRLALEWFDARRGQDIAKPGPINGIHVFNPQTGIQKPAGWVHAVAIRQTLTSEYDDHAPVVATDGSWNYRYFQERTDPKKAARIATNRALIANRDDDVPVAVMIQVKPKPGVRYRVWGLAKVIGFSDGYFHLQGYNHQGGSTAVDIAYSVSTSQMASAAEPGSPISQEDARQRVEAQIVARQGGKAFRDEALKLFKGRCAISGWAVHQVLEAAHIVPYLGSHTNTADNALLLRGDLHTLFDRDLLTIDTVTLRVRIAPALKDTPYGAFDGVAIEAPDSVSAETLRDRLLTRAKIMAS
jgi:putative restriction endonuclease